MGSNVSAILKEKRKELGLSVKTVIDELLSHGVDISDKTLYGWESGHRQPDADTFLVLCKIYGIDSLKGIKKAPLYSSEALKLAQDYDNLDRHGQRMLRLVAKEEKARHAEQEKEQGGISLAARKSDEPHAATGPDTDVEI